MNPVIVIPTYWAADPTQVGVYDHATAIDEPAPELARCLDSLDDVRGVIRTVLLVVASPACEHSARARVNAIVREHPGLNPMVIGSAEARVITGRIEQICPGMAGETVSLRGYGAIRNLGLVVASMLGHDVVVFMDDDEVALSPDFLIDAVYGLGQLTRQNLKILAKTGHFIDRDGSHLASAEKRKLWERWWSKRDEFNEWMCGALAGTRITRSNYSCGGCMVVHAEAFTKVAFDPWITRGEDLDYLFNLRLMGIDMWFDSQWYVRHLPPKTPDEPNRFLQDVYRWCYERAKLDFASQRENLRQVPASSLMPYPGRWISPEVEGRIRCTALVRAIVEPDHAANFRIFTTGRREARVYAERNSQNYIRFLSFWPSIADGVWEDHELLAAVNEATRQEAEIAANAMRSMRAVQPLPVAAGRDEERDGLESDSADRWDAAEEPELACYAEDGAADEADYPEGAGVDEFGAADIEASANAVPTEPVPVDFDASLESQEFAQASDQADDPDATMRTIRVSERIATLRERESAAPISEGAPVSEDVSAADGSSAAAGHSVELRCEVAVDPSIPAVRRLDDDLSRSTVRGTRPTSTRRVDR